VEQTGNGVGPGAPSPERVAELVRSLASVMRQSDVTELDLEMGSVVVRLRRPVQELAAVAPSEAVSTAAPQPLTTSLDHIITAPMIGTFYIAPTPGAPPFVTEGDEVHSGQTIGIIEAMKIMNEITADRSGVVEALLVGNGEPVEYGSPLMRLSIGAGSGERP
jgi:acetyl-CoA carboxylase biotin carboxyl carrier protein